MFVCVNVQVFKVLIILFILSGAKHAISIDIPKRKAQSVSQYAAIVSTTAIP